MAGELGTWETRGAFRAHSRSERRMIELVKVTDVKPLDGHRLWLRFSNGREGARDLSDVLAGGRALASDLGNPSFRQWSRK